MITRRLALAGLGAAPFEPAAAQAPAWPSRPIVFTIPFPAGGSADLLARLLAEKMAPRLSASARMVVENRAGAGGTIGSELCAAAAKQLFAGWPTDRGCARH